MELLIITLERLVFTNPFFPFSHTMMTFRVKRLSFFISVNVNVVLTVALGTFPRLSQIPNG